MPYIECPRSYVDQTNRRIDAKRGDHKTGVKKREHITTGSIH